MRLLVTGMSGVGKSTLVEALGTSGERAIDLDGPDWSTWADADPDDALTPMVGREWIWREDRVADLLASPLREHLFVSGCAANMRRFFPLLDRIVLLTAPVATLHARLAARPAGRYGHDAADRNKVAALVTSVEPLLRAAAHHEIDASQPPAAVLRLVRAVAAAG